jgi:hypothetical protein
MKYDFGFFEESLHTLRRLRSYSIDKSYLLDAPGQVFPELETGMAPKVLEGGEDDPSQVILVRSYARKPGKGLAKLEALLRNRLPDDFLGFHCLYDEALVTTRTYPIHLWNEETIIEEINGWRDLYPYPVRFFRFAQYWDIYGLYYGLWQETDGGDDWRVVICSHNQRDDDLDDFVEKECILCPSFHEWLKDLIARDGLPDPYKEIGPEGGFLDPA